jgi:hypothetical protein
MESATPQKGFGSLEADVNTGKTARVGEAEEEGLGHHPEEVVEED